MKKLNLLFTVVVFLLANGLVFSQAAADRLYLTLANTGRVYDITTQPNPSSPTTASALPAFVNTPIPGGTNANASNLAVGYDVPGGSPSSLVFLQSNNVAGATIYKNGTAVTGTVMPSVAIGGIATNNVPGTYFGNVYGFQTGTKSLYPIYPSGSAIPITSTDTDWNNGTIFGTDTFFDYQNNIYTFINNGSNRYLFKISIATGVAEKAITNAITGPAATVESIQGMAYLQGSVYVATVTDAPQVVTIRKINMFNGTSSVYATYTGGGFQNIDLGTVPYYVPFQFTCGGITQSSSVPFVRNVASNGQKFLNIPISNVYAAGNYTINIIGSNFNSSSVVNITSSTTSINVPLVYDGGGSSGTRTLSVNLNGSSTACSVNVLVDEDTDGDGIGNSEDLDDDNDGILDCTENGLDKPVNQIFELNGNASQISSNEVQLTPALNSQAGQMWSYGKVDFTKSFSMPFEAYLGNKNDDGADGIAIVFHNDPDGIYATGGTGGGIGARGIQNGVVLELDTYDNTEDGLLEPAADHGQIWKSSDQTAITSTVDLPNLEDGAWHAVVVNWDSASQTLSYTVDGTLAGTYTGNIVTNYFRGANKVYFGFTASTGGLNNDQRVRFSSNCSLPLELDTDLDGTPNHLDLDSDNDGCPDAIEGDENVTASQLTANRISGTVDANGVPNLVNSGGAADVGSDQGQGIGEAYTVNPAAVGGTASSNQTIVSGATPAALSLSGHTGTIQWQSSTDNVTFTNISGATSATYAPGALTATTYYRAVLTSAGGCTANSTTVTINIDSDGDGVIDSNDLDDDNDGILDTTEGQCINTSNPSTDGFDSPLVATVNGNNIQSVNPYNGWGAETGGANAFNVIRVDGAGYSSGPDVAQSGTQYIDINSSSAYVYKDIILTTPTVFSASAWFANRESSIGAYAPWSTKIEIRNETTGITVAQGNTINFTSSISDEIWNNSSINSVALPAGTYRIRMYVGDFGHLDSISYCFSKDTDGDGTPDHLDLDSDNDGCADALEGDENVIASQLTSNRISGTVDANGVPNLVNAGGTADIGSDQGQGIGEAYNAAIQSGCFCYKPAQTTGTILDTNHGITALGRAGADNSNWPMVRKGAWTVLEAKTKGFVINRLTNDQINAIPSADLREGMMVYNINQDCLQINIDGTATGWKCFNTQTCPD